MKPWTLCLVAALSVRGAALGGEIHDAAELGNIAKVKACLEKDPKQINSADAKGVTVLDRALRSGKQRVVEFVLERGATEDIYAAAAVGHTAKVVAFLKDDAKLARARAGAGKSALHWAAFYGQKGVVELLLAKKADVNLLDEDGFTPLHWAVMFNRPDVVEVLVRNGADTGRKVAKYGWTPLRLAVIHGHKASAEVLLKSGVDPSVKDAENIPLLHQAVIAGKTEMVKLLVANKCDINEKDEAGDTPLFEAIEHGYRDIIEFLREQGGRTQ